MNIDSLILLDNPNKASKSVAYRFNLPIFEVDESLINLLIETSKLNSKLEF